MIRFFGEPEFRWLFLPQRLGRLDTERPQRWTHRRNQTRCQHPQNDSTQQDRRVRPRPSAAQERTTGQ